MKNNINQLPTRAGQYISGKAVRQRPTQTQPNDSIPFVSLGSTTSYLQLYLTRVYDSIQSKGIFPILLLRTVPQLAVMGILLRYY